MPDTVPPQASSSHPTATPKAPSFPVHTLVLDAGPILSLAPLRGMASRFVAPPQVVAELKDEKARQYWERIQAGLIEGVAIEVKSPDAISLSKVIAFAQKTGDYAVLSKPDLAVLALTYAMDAESKSKSALTSTSKTSVTPGPRDKDSDVIEAEPKAGPSTLPSTAASAPSKPNPWGAIKKPVEANVNDDESESDDDAADNDDEDEEEAFPALPSGPAERRDDGDEEADRKPVEAHLAEMNINPSSTRTSASALPPAQSEREKRIEELRREMQEEEAKKEQFEQVYAEADEEDAGDDGWDESGAGEWITPDNVSKHKAEDLGLLPITRTEAGKSPLATGSTPSEETTGTSPVIKKKTRRAAKKSKAQQVGVACYTGDYAVQNVLVQMGLGLVGEGGKRIKSVKSWVLRCHACFRLCKDPSKKFCPWCGNPTLIRASITTHAPTPEHPTPRVEVHLKQNFQYRTRGTVYSIPAPKMGSSKSASNGGGGLILREDQKEFQRGVKREEGRRWKEEKELERAVKLQMEGRGAGLGSWNDPDWLPEILTTGSSGKGRRTGGEGLPTVGYGRKNPNEARRRKK